VHLLRGNPGVGPSFLVCLAMRRARIADGKQDFLEASHSDLSPTMLRPMLRRQVREYRSRFESPRLHRS